MRAGVYGRQSLGKVKSIEDQIEIGEEVVEAQGWTLAGKYSDAVSASRYGKKARLDWERLRADVLGRSLGVVVVWEASRGSRDAEKWLGFLRECRVAGCLIHVVSHERTYNPAIPRDWETLAQEGIKSEAEANQISLRSARGTARGAKKGRPSAGVCPYGYRRAYDPTTGALLGQEPDPTTAPIVREIFERVAKSEPLHRIADDLNERGIAATHWYRSRIRHIARSRTYLGERKHRDTWHPADWAPIVDPETFASANRVLSGPGRSNFGPHSRPGRQKCLLTFLAKCGRCGREFESRTGVYACPKGCAQAKRDPIDALIRDLVIARLSDPDLYAALAREADAADETLKAARGEAAALRQRLDGLRAKAIEGEISPESFATFEAALLPKIAAAEAGVEAATVPADLEGWVGPAADVLARWEAATVQARRTVIRALKLQISISPAGGRKLPAHERVTVA